MFKNLYYDIQLRYLKIKISRQKKKLLKQRRNRKYKLNGQEKNEYVKEIIEKMHELS